MTSSRALGFEPYTLGEAVDLAIVQTDHADYARSRRPQLPGIRLLVDGRNATDAAAWAARRGIVVGAGAAPL